MGIVIALTMIGLAAGLMIWAGGQFVVAVPEEDRSFLDQPPFGYRLMWPLIRLIEHYVSPLIQLDDLRKIQAKLTKAGVEYSLSPQQFFSGKVIGAIIASLGAFIIANALKMPPLYFIPFGAALGFFYPEIWLKDTVKIREAALLKSLPYYLDIITLSVEAGTNLTGAFTQAVQKSPDGPMRSEISRVLRDVRAGKPRATAMRAMADRVDMPSINNLVSTIVQAERMGSSLGPILRAQADQRRTERFLRAEKLGMEAPVKLLFPLIAFIFPTTFIVIIFVLLMKVVEGGMIDNPWVLWALSWPGKS